MVPFCIWNRAIKSVAEGVGVEPTVGCPTLDFESSALNRTQPPFLFAALIIERRRSNATKSHSTGKLDIKKPVGQIGVFPRAGMTEPKMSQINSCPGAA